MTASQDNNDRQTTRLVPARRGFLQGIAAASALGAAGLARSGDAAAQGAEGMEYSDD